MGAEGHINPARVADRVRERVPGVNASTVYRTLAMLEAMGVLAHAHLESGPEYHRRSESGHVHLICSNCRKGDELSLAEAARLKSLIQRHHGFEPDLSHFAISGLCRECQAPHRVARASSAARGRPQPRTERAQPPKKAGRIEV
jgi:Fur family ferric uptake transcriptional regulator